MTGIDYDVQRLSLGEIIIDVLRQLVVHVPLLIVFRDAEALHVVAHRPVPLMSAVAAIKIDEKLLLRLCEEIEERATVLVLGAVDFLGRMCGKLVSIDKNAFDPEFVAFAEFDHALDVRAVVDEWIGLSTSDQGSGSHFDVYRYSGLAHLAESDEYSDNRTTQCFYLYACFIMMYG